MNSDITLQIYSYVKLFGPTTPSTMRNRLEMKKTSVFRSLDYLSSLNLIKKMTLDEAIDGSKQAYSLNQSFEEINRSINMHKVELNEELRIDWENALIAFPSRLNEAFHTALAMFEPVENIRRFDLIQQGIFDAERMPGKLEQIMQFIHLLNENEDQENNYLVDKQMRQPISVTIRISGYTDNLKLIDFQDRVHLIHRNKE